MNSFPFHIPRAWVPTLTLGVSAFVFVTAEVLPVGLLPDIARSLAKSEADAGLLLTVYAWGVALLGMPLTMLTSKIDRRALVLALFAIFIFGNSLSAVALSFSVLMTARLFVATAHSVFWAITPPLALRVAPPEGRAKAMSIVFTGSSLATVLGVPFGALLGHYLDWRFAFGAVAVAALLTVRMLYSLLPSEPAQNASDFSSLSGILKNKLLLRVYALTVLTTTGHFTAFTYFASFMQSVGGLDAKMIAVLLLTLGVASLFGGIVGSKLIERPGEKTAAIPLLAMSLLFLTMPLTVRLGTTAIFVMVFLWGVVYTFVTMVLQLRVIDYAPATADLATAIFSGSFNFGVGLGALVGRYVFTLLGVVYTPCMGALLLAAAAGCGFLNIKARRDRA